MTGSNQECRIGILNHMGSNSMTQTSSLNLDPVNWTGNRFENGDFERWGNPLSPAAMSNLQARERYAWLASAPWPVSEGSHSGGLQARATDEWLGSNTYWAQLPNTQIDNTTLEFRWYLYENHDPGLYGDTFYLWIRLTDGKNIYYFLNGTTGGSNSSTNGFYKIGGPSQTWNSFSRNITADYEDLPEFGEPTSSIRISTLYFWIHSTGRVNQYIRGFIDDVWLKYGADVHIGDWERNGNLESTYYWIKMPDSDHAEVSQSAVAHTGDWSLNLTVDSNGNDSLCGVWQDVCGRLTPLNSGTLRFWYNIADWTEASIDTYAYVAIECTNTTDDFDIYYYFAHGGIGMPETNETYRLVIHPTAFNITGGWTLFNQSICSDAVAYFNTDEIRLERISLYAMSSEKGGRMEILVDDFEMVSARVNDMGYEDQGAVGERILGWNSPSGGYDDHETVLVTDFSYDGTKAANITVWEDYDPYLTQPLAITMRNETQTVFDITWRLESYLQEDGTWATMFFEFANGYKIYYYFARNNPVSNSSTEMHIDLPMAGTTHEWIRAQRNLVTDYTSYFGNPDGIEIVSVSLMVVSMPGELLTLLLDEFYVYDDTYPVLESIQGPTTAPEAFEPVPVTADAYDFSLDGLYINYRVEGGAWQQEPMLHESGTTYNGSIPGQPYDALVEYYVTAVDGTGDTVRIPEEGVYENYTTVDTIKPTFTWGEGMAAISGSQVGGVIGINITVSDSGSGVRLVEIYYGGTSVSEPISPPSDPGEYVQITVWWDTTKSMNREYSISVTVHDAANNTVWGEMGLVVYNPVTTTSTTTTSTAPPSDALPLIIGAAVVIGVVAVAMIYLAFVKPRQSQKS
ncbi:MAG: hypothetical protein EAX81_08045 [Candidatus Thorarchaeota archaeon]|nr:hypothetical protein [Candidatus Thorarchaeota archaeon]